MLSDDGSEHGHPDTRNVHTTEAWVAEGTLDALYEPEDQGIPFIEGTVLPEFSDFVVSGH
ncbi:MAG: hypothetical protein V4662_02120 [Verrucomicrobiota bacterium]